MHGLLCNYVFALVVLSFGAFSVGACAVTSEDVEQWKTTVKGPQKLVAVILADKYPLELRAKAALALVQMNRTDVDGVQELITTFRRLRPETQSELIAQMVPEIQKVLDATKVEPGQEPPAEEVRAKDAAFVLLPYTPVEAKTRLVDALVGWYVKDFNGRNLAGTATADQVIRAVGSPAAPILVKALNERIPQEVLVKLSEIIGQVGEDAAKADAAKRLVEIEKTMRTDAFVAWLEQEIMRQIKVQKPDAKIDPARIKVSAVFNRQLRLVEGAITSMKHVADQTVVADRLMAIAQMKSDSDEEVAQRVAALQAMEGNAKKKFKSAFLTLALNDGSPPQVKDYAFDRLGEVGDKSILPQLWPLLKGSKDPKLRWHTGELVLSVGGPAELQKFFTTLPSGNDASYLPEELDGYASRIGQMKPLPDDEMRTRLRAGPWFAQVIALKFFERKGTTRDAADIEALVKATTKPVGPGWSKDDTIGAMASQTLKELQKGGQNQGEDDAKKS